MRRDAETIIWICGLFWKSKVERLKVEGRGLKVKGWSRITPCLAWRNPALCRDLKFRYYGDLKVYISFSNAWAFFCQYFSSVILIASSNITFASSLVFRLSIKSSAK